ncbi:MAG: acyl-CoA dehydratase activase-related protein [Bacillota bacterium]|nr:acyl-CoA dehydratase activase-related protein [Bacillota bacterium]
MPAKVGIPRSLSYYQLFPLWKTFFEEMGAELVVSGPTTKKILDDGVKCCVDEACLPVKLFHGHVADIKDRVDYLFIPRLTSISKGEYICPKFGGLPDMVRTSLHGLPEIISTEINLRKNKRNSLKAAMEIGHYFTDKDSQIKSAYKKAVGCYNLVKDNFEKGYIPDFIRPGKTAETKSLEKDRNLNIALVGHTYNIYDSFVNMNIWRKLENKNANIITIEMVDEKAINRNARQLPKKIFWNYGRKAVGSAMHLLNEKNLDGVIYVMSFGCGIDSFVCDLVERRIRRTTDLPFIVITLDEHSGEAGLDTRLEAFIDMVRWRCTDKK